MIETTHIRLEQAAEILKTPVDTLLTAGLEGRIRIWALLYEWREFWVRERRSEDPWDTDNVPAEVGEAFFDFVPLFGWHVAALLKNGRVESDVLDESNGLRKVLAGDGQPYVIVTREQPLYLLSADIACIKLKGELPVSAPEQPDREIGPRAQTTYQNIIGGLLDVLLGKSPAGRRYSILENQTAIIDTLISNYPRKPGITRRTLEEKFAEAKRSLDAS
ncbi:MAG: hypothetical protein KBG29_07720 [Pseudomonadales bacterium]|nr:hypothetical protein [Pseudomonadales bacterium]